MTETILICGGSGFVSQHFIAYLQNHDSFSCSEIRTVDRRPFSKFLEYPDKLPVKNYQYDLCDDSEELNSVFVGCTAVVYCAGKNFDYLYTQNDPSEQLWHDNLLACESVIRRMVKNDVKRLVYVGDAYANLPNSDNYGLSEQMHLGAPQSYVLGLYGESKTKAELIARNAAEEGKINALFLRPTFIYGEGEKHLITSLLKVCKSYGGYPNISGSDRGNHQYIYAGNLAAIIYKSLECLKSNPEKYNAEVIYCMDDTVCTTFQSFIKPFMETFKLLPMNEVSYVTAFLSSIYYQTLYSIGLMEAGTRLSFRAQRFLYGWTIGFANRKLRLLLDFLPPFEQCDAIKKTLLWYHNNQAFLDEV